MNFFTDLLLMGGSNYNWIVQILFSILMFIDALVYETVAGVYSIFMALCGLNLSAFAPIFDGFINRIYMLLGIIMLFIISFNLLKMLVDPSKASDAHMGGGALLKRILISIIMLIMAPFVFDMLDEAQTAIVEDGIIEQIILGTSSSDNIASQGPNFSWALFSAFYYPTSGDWTSCTGCSSKVKEAWGELDAADYKLSQFATVAADSTVQYTPVVSTIVGIVIIFQLLKFSLGVGVRAFKLLFLRVMAPIPLIYYMDPGKGDTVFKAYTKEYIGSYLELFVKIGTLFLSILLASLAIPLVRSGDLFNSFQLKGLANTIAQGIVVIALFQFADKIPEMIGNIFGIKMDYKGGIGKLGAGLIGAAGGVALGGAGALAGSIARGDMLDKDGHLSWGGVGKVAANALGGATRGGVGGGKSLAKAGLGAAAFGALGKAGSTAIANQAKSSEQSRLAGGFFQKQFGRVDRALGGEYRAARASERYTKGVESAQKNLQTAQANRTALSGIRSVAEKQFTEQYAREKGITMDQVRTQQFTNAEGQNITFDQKVTEWMTSAEAANNQAFQQSMQEYRQDYNVDENQFNASTFGYAEEAAATTVSAAKENVKSAESAKSEWENKGLFSVKGENGEKRQVGPSHGDRQKFRDATKGK